ncbi:hypothetical protein PanWU01x14_001390 [Parasponia andersonii]|uniref:Uncharacterized protein n=1 Tax=Parasponia andersonii TaxID=3476 RepID=A0A2P5E4X5_PARAD|nr:hypothetical protein PanWU01x14_001390 [Parasponia andersonii]
MLDRTPSASARCKLATALLSILSHLLSSVISTGLSPIDVRQLSFLKIAFIFIFHKEKLLTLNFSISNFAAILVHHDLFSYHCFTVYEQYHIREQYCIREQYRIREQSVYVNSTPTNGSDTTVRRSAL